MKFFRNASLFQRSLYFFGLLSILFLAECLIIQERIARIEELHYHQNYARKAQALALEADGLVDAVTAGTAQLPELIATIDEHDRMLTVVGEGGRVDETAIMIDGLSSLPQISHDQITRHWDSYKRSLSVLTNGGTLSTVQRNISQAQWLAIRNWYDKLITDLDHDLVTTRSNFHFVFALFVVIDFALFGLIFYLFNQTVLRPLKQIETNTQRHEHTRGLPNHEVGKAAFQVNEVIEQLRDASEFVKRIEEGDLTLDYRTLDSTYERGKNHLADSLVDMQSKLRQLNEEDRRRRWVNEGLTKFVEILRSSDDTAVLGDKIISMLTQYMQSSQGSLYLLNDDERTNIHLELVSLFAFDIKKHESRKIKPGQGLLGQTFLEKETTYLTQVPDTYVRISSGLGDDKPKSILIVPLKMNTEVYGVLELASFNLFEDYEIAFVEKLGESIAATLANVKAAHQTKRLLDESKSATEMMRSQEEEMRQNMEELQATQEEMARKERDYLKRIEELEQAVVDDTRQSEIARLEIELKRVQETAERKIQTLKEELASKGESIGESTEGMEEALRVNLEAVKIMYETLSNKKTT